MRWLGPLRGQSSFGATKARASTSSISGEDLDGRDKPGHDDGETAVSLSRQLDANGLALNGVGGGYQLIFTGAITIAAVALDRWQGSLRAAVGRLSRRSSGAE